MPMTLVLAPLLKYGYLILFSWVLLEQLGVPVPSVPMILTVGTLTATHRMNWALSMLAILLACGLSDSLWFWLGGRYGNSILRQLCRISLEPGTCVQKTKVSFQRRGAMTLLWAKFVPGLSTVAPPIAGQSGVPFGKFLALDLAGAMVWSGSFLLAGRFFGDAIERSAVIFHWIGHFSLVLVLLLVVGMVGYRVWSRHRFFQSVAQARISAESLKGMMDNGENPFIVDLRHPLDYLQDPRVLPTAVRLVPEEIAGHINELPLDRDIILYCTCPSDASSATTALKLRKLGIERVRPLSGGFEGWRDLQFPLVQYQAGSSVMAASQTLHRPA